VGQPVVRAGLRVSTRWVCIRSQPPRGILWVVGQPFVLRLAHVFRRVGFIFILFRRSPEVLEPRARLLNWRRTDAADDATGAANNVYRPGFNLKSDFLSS